MHSACTTHFMLCFYSVPCLALPCPALPCPDLPCPALPCASPVNVAPVSYLQLCNRCLGIACSPACSPACIGSIHGRSLCGKCFPTLLLCLQTKSLQTRQDSAPLQIPPPPNHSQAVTAQPMCMMATFVPHHSPHGQLSENQLTAMAS